jgi:pyruvate carboxylase subunit B
LGEGVKKMSKKLIKVMNTSFRDGLQSVFGARVLTKDFLPAFEAAIDAGMYHFEVGGGARFQSLYFYCNEDAFDMMSTLRSMAGSDIKLQIVARGVYAQSMEPESSDVINLHNKLYKKHGADIIRNFDALNDYRNLEYASKSTIDNGLGNELVITMMELPPGCKGAHDVAFYRRILVDFLEAKIPYTSICFKDASGSSDPNKVYETIKMARDILPKDTELRFHTHETAGCSVACYLAALNGGVDAIDLAMAPVSGGTAQPDILTMMHALKDTDFDLGFDINKILKAEKVFQECLKDYFVPPESGAVNPLIPISPMPGGALTANTQMMRDNDLMEKYPAVIRAMSDVVSKGGYGTSVTPLSQFYFQQAFNNVMFGLWKRIAKGYGKMVLGCYGKTPVEPDKDVVKIAAEQLGIEPTTKQVLDTCDKDPNKGLDVAKKVLQDNNIEETEENLFVVATCGDKGVWFLKGNAKINIRKSVNNTDFKEPKGYTVKVDGNEYGVVIDGGTAVVNGKKYSVDVGLN